MGHRFAIQTRQLAAGLLLVLLSLNVLFASEVEKWLLMPGEVIERHAHIEADCDSCHAPLSDTEQGGLCIDCHEEIAGDLSRSGGFHGHLPEEQRLDCAGCHTDHEGRDADVVHLDLNLFDHAMTDFGLLGAHRDLTCASCHDSDTSHRNTPSQCVSCHRDEDVHNGALGEVCATCHTSNDWQETRFDHSTTAFSLTGAHINATCESCHTSPVFAEVGKTCVACHQSDDVHKGQNGEDCGSCHLTDNWGSTTFDHLAVSGFALIGGHNDLTCNTCHAQDDYRDLGNSSCQSCHKNDDVHNGSFGSACANCHNVNRWRSTEFDHTKQTDFVLPPGHTELSCDSCHQGSLQDPLPRDCGTCHRDNDPHNGQLGAQCESCHVATDWTAQLWFDHDITLFPLIGKHAEVTCAQCHDSMAFHDTPSDCVSCHQEDDPHGGSLGQECATCHNPAAWPAVLFDHDTDTAFPLTGAHTGPSCSSCHRPGESPDAAEPDCVSCHRRDDRHDGRFGENCDSCHTTESFSQIGDN